MKNARRFSDQIRAAVDASGMSRYAICKAIGFNQGAMSRFMSGGGGPSMGMMDKLADLLGLGVVMEAQAAKIRAGVIDPKAIGYRDQEARPIGEHLADFRAALLAKGGTRKHAL